MRPAAIFMFGTTECFARPPSAAMKTNAAMAAVMFKTFKVGANAHSAQSKQRDIPQVDAKGDDRQDASARQRGQCDQ